MEDELRNRAFHDELTGLPNRASMLEKISEKIVICQDDYHRKFALMFLDGDQFKLVNDTHGHLFGDRLLVESAHRLTQRLPENYHLARLGGDEFTILSDVNNEGQLQDMCAEIVNVFEQPFVIDNNQIHFKVSLGAVLCDESYTLPVSVLRDADIAMYAAKESGRGVYRIFDTDMRMQVLERAEIEAELRHAIEREELSLVYQPIVEFDLGEILGFEALLRWDNASKGSILPDKFIPIAEESGLILPIGLWVLEEACGQMVQWTEQFSFSTPLWVSVNLSSTQFSQPDFIECIDNILTRTTMDCRFLKLEITESVLMENIERAHTVIEALRFRGIQLAIDDFGTGYSSLSYLDELPVQILKIDRKFVSGNSTDRQLGKKGTLEIVRATISMAHSLRMEVVAEGIETEEQYDILRVQGCDLGQGSFISMPLDRFKAVEFIEQSRNCKSADTSVNSGDKATPSVSHDTNYSVSATDRRMVRKPTR